MHLDEHINLRNCHGPKRTVPCAGSTRICLCSKPFLSFSLVKLSIAMSSRLTKRKLDDLMGRSKKRTKSKSSKNSARSAQSSGAHRKGTAKEKSQVSSYVTERRHDGEASSNPLNPMSFEPSGIPECDDISDAFHVGSHSNNEPINLPEYPECNTVYGVQLDDVDDMMDGCVDDEGKCTTSKITTDNLLACLLTSGSQRISSIMYTVVRLILGGKACAVCGSMITGAKLPGLTYLKTHVKPTVKRHLLARHDVIQMKVDHTRAGAKTGIGRYFSTLTAPMAIVKPSEWARIDFRTPSIRKLIWEDNNDGEEVMFGSIEETPIVRNRSKFTSENTVRGSGGLECHVGKGSILELTLIRNTRTDIALEKAFGDEVVNKKIEGVACAVVTCHVVQFQYIKDDSYGHSCFVDDEGEARYERHSDSCEKAGDVVFYLKTIDGEARLVNRHNCEGGESGCSLELCNGKLTGCHVRAFHVEDVVCLNDVASPADDYVPNTGFLADGTRYFVYRMLLYTDGFNAHRTRLGSVDGMYMIPLGIPLNSRTEAGCLHKICLAPPGIEATDVMAIIIKDIVDGMTEGIEVMFKGEKALIFLDCLCYNGDCPALASALGTKGHRGDCPCHVCSFRRKKKGKLSIVTSNGVSSVTCSAKRTHRKVRDIQRQTENNAGTLEIIGVGKPDAPLLVLSDEIKKLENIPKTSEGKQVVPNCFDGFRFSLVSPDHVFLGLISNVLQNLLKYMKPVERAQFDKCITGILGRNGLLGRSSILSSDNSILKTTITESFAIIFATPLAVKCCNWDLEGADRKALKKTVDLVQSLSDIIVDSQCHPSSGVDGTKDIRSFNESKGRTRLEKLAKQSIEHCKIIEELSNVDETTTRNLDKPNMHRFVELFVHTLPMFGSMKYIEELILEKGHQHAKRAIEKSNKKNEQLQAMTDYLYDDFVARLKSLTRTADKENVKKEVEQLFGFESTGEDLLDVGSLINGEILSVLRTLGKDICHRREDEHWDVVECSSEFKYPGSIEPVMKKSKAFVESALELIEKRDNWKDGKSCKLGSSAMLVKPVGELNDVRRVGKTVPFDVLETHFRQGVEKRPFVFRRSELDGERRFIATIGYLKTKHDDRTVVYAVRYFMEELDCNENLYKCKKDCVVILELSRSVRKAFVCHACWKDESHDVDGSKSNGRVTCKKGCKMLLNREQIVDGGTWVLKGRTEGYPPRSG